MRQRRFRAGRRLGGGARDPVWLFDLDNTLHDATTAAYAGINSGMTEYIERELGLSRADADALRRRYWLRYGATLLGLVRHHAVVASHFLHHVHLLPGLEARVRGHGVDIAALARLPGRRVLLTNAPAAYTQRVLKALGLSRHFDAVLAIEDLRMFGQLRPKPDARMYRALAARLKVPASRCVLIEDTLANLKGAHRVGMQTAWMQRWLKTPSVFRHAPPHRLQHRPAYVQQRIRHLRGLR